MTTSLAVWFNGIAILALVCGLVLNSLSIGKLRTRLDILESRVNKIIKDRRRGDY